MATTTSVKLIIDAVDNASKTLKGIGDSFGSINKDLAKTGAGLIALGAAPTAALIGSAKAAINFEDALANVRKTTGATDDQLAKISKELLEMSTASRTSAKELLDIATIGGQMGIAADEVIGFTDAVDKVAVALSDEFAGGAEEVTRQMGTLRNLFADVKSDNISDDILHIANAVNELGASGLATGGYMAEAARRIAGVAVPLGMSSGEVLGFSAAMEELGFNVERGSSAVVRTLQVMAKDTAGFAEVAGMSLKEFENLVNEDINGAFLAVLDGINKINPSATEMAQILDDLGLSGVGNAELFMKMAGSTELLAEKQKLAADMLTGTDSIMTEFNTKNQTTQAELDKLKNNFHKLAVEIGSNVLPGINDTIERVTAFVQELSKFNDAHPGVITGALKVGAAIGGIGTAMVTVSTLAPGFRATLLGLQTAFVVLGNVASLSLGLGLVKNVGDAGAALSLFGGVAKGALVKAGAAIITFGGQAVAAAVPVIVAWAPVIAIILVIAAVIALLALAWKNNWGDIQGKTQVAVDFVKEKFNQLREGVGLFIEGVKTKFEEFKTFVTSIPEIFTTFVEGVRMKFEEIKTAITTKVDEIKTGVVEKIVAFKDAVMAAFTWENFLQIWYDFWYNIGFIVGNALAFLLIDIPTKLAELWLAFLNWVTLLGQMFWVFFTETIPAAWNAFVTFMTETVPALGVQFVLWITDMLTKAWQEFVKFCTVTVPDAFRSLIQWLTVEIPKLKENFIQWITEMGQKAWEMIVKFKDDAIQTIQNLITSVIASITQFVRDVIAWFQNMKTQIQNTIANLPSIVANAFNQAKEKAISIARDMYNGVKEWVDKIIGMFNNIISKAGEALNKAKEAVSEGFKAGFSRQTGGTIPGAIGEAVPTLMHAGERVIPAGVGATSIGSGGGASINFSVSIGMYAGTETEKRNIARDLYAALLQVAQAQNKSVSELMGG